MKKTKILIKLCAAVMAFSVCCAAAETLNCATCAEAAKIGNSVQNVIINYDYKNLTVNSSSLTCTGETRVPSGYNAKTTVELQQFDGAWYTIKSWSALGGTVANIRETYSPAKGYSYRLKVTHSAYNSGWSLVESFTKTGSSVYYN